MKLKRLICIIYCSLFLFINQKLSAQQFDETYIQQYKEKVYFSPKYLYKHSTIRLRPQGRVLDWQTKLYPNTPNSLGFQFRYKSISFGAGFAMPIAKSKKIKFGNSNSIDINIKIARPKYNVELFVKNYQGLADLNSPNYPLDSQYDQLYYQRPDLKFLYLKSNFIYIFNAQQYSYRGAFTFIERQKKSAGSPLLIGNVSFVRLKGDSSIIAPAIREAYPQSWSLQKLGVLDSGVGAGYGYTFVHNQLFASGILFLGIDYQNNQYLLDQQAPQQKHQRNAVPLIDFRASIGYNNDRFFAGVVATSDYNLIKFEEIKGRFNYLVVAFRIGMRFAAPKGLERLELKSPLKQN